MTVGSALLSFAALAAVLTIIPGLDTSLVLRSALTQRRAASWATALGICSGSFVWGAAAAVGATAVLQASELAFAALKIAGAIYLAWLGIGLLRAGFRRSPAAEDDDTAARPRGADSVRASFGRGALSNLLNPKAGVFYIATVPFFLPEGVPPLGMGLLLALVHVVETLLWFALLIVAAGYARRWLSSPRVSRWIDRITGTVLVGFGVAIAVETRV